MSRAEERALEVYPEDIQLFVESQEEPGKWLPVDENYQLRYGYKRGYEQAEKDLGWISVNDRLPDTTEYVFTCIKMNGIPQCVGFHYYKNGKWWDGYEEDTVGAVEYWMQIPKFEEDLK